VVATGYTSPTLRLDSAATVAFSVDGGRAGLKPSVIANHGRGRGDIEKASSTVNDGTEDYIDIDGEDGDRGAVVVGSSPSVAASFNADDAGDYANNDNDDDAVAREIARRRRKCFSGTGAGIASVDVLYGRELPAGCGEPLVAGLLTDTEDDEVRTVQPLGVVTSESISTVLLCPVLLCPLPLS
jgi:hypothetical protein